MRSSEIRLRKLKLRLRDKRFANHKAPCIAIWQQLLQSVLALRSCSAMDLILSFNQRTMHHGFQSYTASVSSSCWQAGADLASSREWRGVATANDAQHPHTALASTCIRLTVATTYVQIDVFLQANLYFS